MGSASHRVWSPLATNETTAREHMQIFWLCFFYCRGAEHFGPPPIAPRLGNQRSWYVQLCLCDLAYKISRDTYRKEKGMKGMRREGEGSPGGRFPPSFIHQVFIITELNKLYNRMFSP